MQTHNPQGMAIVDPNGIIWTNLIESHFMMTHTKYQCSWLYGLAQEDLLIVWCLMPFSTVFQLCRSHHCTYPCFLLTSTPHNILSKPQGTFPHNHSLNNGHQWKRNESCCNDYHLSVERILAKPGIEPVTSCSQVRNATNWALGLYLAQEDSHQTSHRKILENVNLSQTSPGFYVSTVQFFWKHCGKRRICK